jgi:hypothetical protein
MRLRREQFVQKTVKEMPRRRNPHLKDITVVLLAGMDEDKPLHGDIKEAG